LVIAQTVALAGETALDVFLFEGILTPLISVLKTLARMQDNASYEWKFIRGANTNSTSFLKEIWYDIISLLNKS